MVIDALFVCHPLHPWNRTETNQKPVLMNSWTVLDKLHRNSNKLLITDYSLQKSNIYLLLPSQIISYVSHYFTILLSQPSQLPKKKQCTINSAILAPKTCSTVLEHQLRLMAANLKTCIGIATLSVTYQNFNISDSSNQNKPLVEKYISACLPHHHKISADKKRFLVTQ